MKSYFKVSFEYSEGIYCTNMAHAESAADVEKSYSKYNWCSVREAAPYELDEAKGKGMPIIEIEHEEPATEEPAQTERADTVKKPVSVSNLTLYLWLDFVRPVLRDAGMLEEVPAQDEWHEYTSEVIEEATADEIAHCMTVACFNAHGAGKYATIEEAAQLVYQMEVSAKYRKETAEVIATIRAALALKVADAIAEIVA